ncbi:MAG: DsbA family protein, partial [Burkholderiales bacterium]|nr:DsbA family protein [Burkholderiales bacterium]
MSATLQFYFDPISPYAWLASKALPRLEAAGLQVQCQPVLFAGLLNAHGQKGPAEIPAKREYTFRDVMRLAAMQGLSFVGPPGHPFNPLQALRLCCTVPQGNARNQLALTLMAAVWEQGIDISDTQQLGHILDANGYPSRELLAASATPEIKQQLQQNTDEAISKGGQPRRALVRA